MDKLLEELFIEFSYLKYSPMINNHKENILIQLDKELEKRKETLSDHLENANKDSLLFNDLSFHYKKSIYSMENYIEDTKREVLKIKLGTSNKELNEKHQNLLYFLEEKFYKLLKKKILD